MDFSTLLKSAGGQSALGDVGGSLIDFAGGLFDNGPARQRAAIRAQAARSKSANEGGNTAIQNSLADVIRNSQGVQSQQQQNLSPYTGVGSTAATGLNDFYKNDLNKEFTGTYNEPTYNAPGAFQDTGFNYKQSPGFKNVLEQVRKADEASGASRGMLGSGQTLRQIGQDSGNAAAADYQNEFNNYNTNRSFRANQGNIENQFNRNNFDTDKTFGYNKYRNDLTDFHTNLTDKYNKLFQGTQLGQTATQGPGGLNDTLKELLASINPATLGQGTQTADYLNNNANIDNQTSNQLQGVGGGASISKLLKGLGKGALSAAPLLIGA